MVGMMKKRHNTLNTHVYSWQAAGGELYQLVIIPLQRKKKVAVGEGTFALTVALHWSPVSLECNTVNISYNKESLGPRKAKMTLTNHGRDSKKKKSTLLYFHWWNEPLVASWLKMDLQTTMDGSWMAADTAPCFWWNECDWSTNLDFIDHRSMTSVHQIGQKLFVKSHLTFHRSSRTHRCSLVAVALRFTSSDVRTQRSVRWALGSHAPVQAPSLLQTRRSVDELSRRDGGQAPTDGTYSSHFPLVCFDFGLKAVSVFPCQTSCLKPSYVHDGTLPVPCCQTEDTVTFQRFYFSSVCWPSNASLFWRSSLATSNHHHG